MKLNNEGTEHLRRKHQQGFPYKGMIFNFFPKGTRIPPSGPSNRHNAVVDSTPQN
ncbi:Protein IDA-LIKE 1 [Sesbania bispinosa]|nr:Protein IDA-LIKE 1 [Sesbania bispinosa]